MKRAMGMVALGLMLGAGQAHADEEKPWAKGVSTEKQDAAIKLFQEGNTLYSQEAYTGAAEKYREALKLWDHPALHLNLANSLVKLDKTLDAAEEMQAALKYDGAPFAEKDKYDQALLLNSALKSQTGWIEISCDQAGAKVQLDGALVLSCPGTQKVHLLAKEHAINAELKDHLGVSRRVVVPGGNTLQEKIKLVPLADAVITKYKYPKWIPWTVAGAGGAVAIGGLLTYINGRSQMAEFDQNFGATFGSGATEAELKEKQPLLYEQRESAKFRGTLGISLMAVGGGAVVGGLFFGLVLNRPVRELPKLDVAPTNGGATAMFRGTF